MKVMKILLLAGVSAVLAGCGDSVPEVCDKLVDKSIEQAKSMGIEPPSRDSMIEDLKRQTGGDEERMEMQCGQALKALESVDNMKKGLLNLFK